MENNNCKIKNYFNIILLSAGMVFFLSISFWVGFLLGRNQTNNQSEFFPINETLFINKDGNDKNVDFSLFWKSLNILREKYIDSGKIDSYQILYGAIKGMMQSTGDPYTVFLDPSENKDFIQNISGSFEGIGAEIGVKQGIIVVIAPLKESPAEKAGLKAGDKIIKIDGEITSEMSLDEAVKKMRGEKNTNVTLTIWRNGDNETKDVTITRDVINVKSVSHEIKNDSIAYIKIIRFAEDTDSDFIKSVNEVMRKNVKGYIIDLRNNPGGYLDAAINIASKMISKNNIILVEENEKGEKKNIVSRGGDILSEYPTVVLINEGSASASEILAAALRENRNNVTVVGMRSYGKGSVQEFIDLPQNTAAKITVARWLTPQGKQINEAGITPDIEVDLTNEDYNKDNDPQLDKALEILTK